MSSTVVKPLAGTPPAFNQALVAIDADPLASRVVIHNRSTSEIINACNNRLSHNVKMRVPFNFATTNDLVVTMLDDTRQFNALVADGVQAEIIDGTVTSIY